MTYSPSAPCRTPSDDDGLSSGPRAGAREKGIPVSQEDFPGDGGGQLGERMAAPPARSRSRTSCSAPGVAVPVHSLSAGWLEVHSGSRVATGSPQSVEKCRIG